MICLLEVSRYTLLAACWCSQRKGPIWSMGLNGFGETARTFLQMLNSFPIQECIHSVYYLSFYVFKDQYIIYRINSKSVKFKIHTSKVNMIILRSKEDITIQIPGIHYFFGEF